MAKDNAKETGKVKGRGNHPNSRIALKAAQFTSENQPENKGRPKGSPDRKTSLKKFIYCKSELHTQDGKRMINLVTGQPDKLTMEEWITLSQIRKALSGDTGAYREIMDTLYGEKEKRITINITDAAKEAMQRIMDECGLSETEAAQITAQHFDIEISELIH